MGNLSDFAEELYRHFPKLAQGNHTLKSCFDPSYNCLAFALSLSGWRNPEPGDYRATIQFLQKDFGYRVTSSSRFERGYEKVAIYADAQKQFKHIAKQSGSKWVSKLGQLHDLEHASLDLLVGTYGNVVAFLKRKRGQRRRRKRTRL